jgi:hypothetical protein
VGAIIGIAFLGSVIWVGYDAHKLGMRRGQLGGGTLDMGVASWVVCCLFVWIIAFPCYFVARDRYQSMRSLSAAPYGRLPVPVTGFSPGPQFQHAQVPVLTGYAAPPQYSPDGQWWWNGQQWVPASLPG